MLLGAAERFAEQNQDWTTGKAPVWILLDVLIHREVGTSLPPLLGELGLWRTGTPEAHQCCSGRRLQQRDFAECSLFAGR